MNQDDPKGLRKDETQPRAQHGYRNEVSWDGGKGRQPYTNPGGELPRGAAQEFEGGDAGDVAGRNSEQMEQVTGKPGASEEETPRK